MKDTILARESLDRFFKRVEKFLFLESDIKLINRINKTNSFVLSTNQILERNNFLVGNDIGLMDINLPYEDVIITDTTDVVYLSLKEVDSTHMCVEFICYNFSQDPSFDCHDLDVLITGKCDIVEGEVASGFLGNPEIYSTVLFNRETEEILSVNRNTDGSLEDFYNSNEEAKKYTRECCFDSVMKCIASAVWISEPTNFIIKETDKEKRNTGSVVTINRTNRRNLCSVLSKERIKSMRTGSPGSKSSPIPHMRRAHWRRINGPNGMRKIRVRQAMVNEDITLNINGKIYEVI